MSAISSNLAFRSSETILCTFLMFCEATAEFDRPETLIVIDIHRPMLVVIVLFAIKKHRLISRRYSDLSIHFKIRKVASLTHFRINGRIEKNHDYQVYVRDFKSQCGRVVYFGRSCSEPSVGQLIKCMFLILVCMDTHP